MSESADYLMISRYTLHKYVYALIFLPLFTRFFTDTLGMPYTIMPLFDIAEICLLFISCHVVCRRGKEIRSLQAWVLSFLACGVVSIIANSGTTISNLFYSSRPYLRLVLAILLSALALRLQDVYRMYRYMEILLYVNAVIMTYQFCLQGLRQDIVGGTFGNSQGVNSIQNALCVFVFCITLVMYLRGQTSVWRLSVDTLVTGYIAMLAEINMLIFEMVFIAVLAIVFDITRSTCVSPRTAILAVTGGFIAICGVYLFMLINPERVFLLSPHNILEYLGFFGGNTGVYKISRLKVFTQLGNRFFSGDIKGWLFGYGLGNCSTHSAFYDAYNQLQYTYFSSSNVFLETGLVGSFINLGLILAGIVQSYKNNRTLADKEKAWIDISIIMSLIMFLMYFYNTTLRDVYTAYFSGMILSIPYILSNSEQQERLGRDNL